MKGGPIMSLQKEFLDFNDRIKLDYETKKELADKRDILIDILQNSDRLPSFSHFNQGSYGMHLGTEPVNGREYDIDVGLKFHVNKEDYEPTDIKNTIADILKDHTDYGATIKKPCVTVTYKKNGEAAYHVDLVTYAYEDCQDANSQLFLAHGKDSVPDEITWEKSDPIGLLDYITASVTQGNARDQFRRIIRYLKRWKHLYFSNSGHSEPASIGITLIAADTFVKYEDNDLEALFNIVKAIQNLFVPTKFENNRWLYRIKCPMPSILNFSSNTDAFGKMTDVKMTDFKDKIEKLAKDLQAVKDEVDEAEQCKMLQKIFDSDFHVPDAKDVSKQQRNYIPSSSASGMA